MKNYQGVYKFPILGKILRLVHRLVTIGRIETELTQRILELERSTSKDFADCAARLDTSLTSFRGEMNTSLTSFRGEINTSLTSFRGEMSHAISGQRNEWQATLSTNSRVI